MKKQFRLGVIGCSTASTAVLRGVVLSDLIREKKIIVCDKSESELEKLGYLGVNTTDDYRFTAENCDYLLFAVKPARFEEVAAQLQGIRPEKVISVMDGVSKNTIKNSLGVGLIKVARCVLNLPCMTGSGVVGIDMADFNKSTDDTDFLSNVFGCLGQVVSLEESKLAAVSAVSGNGPAYSFMFAKSLISAGVGQGLTKNEAKILAVQTILGSMEMIEREEKSVDELIMQACNGGGAYVDAVKAFDENKFDEVIRKAVEACAARAESNKK